MSNPTPIAAQKFHYYNGGMIVCYPKLESTNSKHTWDARKSHNSKKWEMALHQSCTFDLITNAGYKEGDIIIARLDVVAGKDATCKPETFVVTNNGKRADFNAGGDTGNSSLLYVGMSDVAAEQVESAEG